MNTIAAGAGAAHDGDDNSGGGKKQLGSSDPVDVLPFESRIG